MTRQKRRIIFYSLTLLFFIVGPLIVAYAAGFTFNFSTARFYQTGGVFIKSKTPRLSVFMDGVFLRETGLLAGSALLPDIAPGAHLVRLEKIGFRSWSKTVTVAPAEVTELRDIILAPHPVAAATSTREAMADAAATSTPAAVFALDRHGRLTAGSGRDAEVIGENVHSYASAGDSVFFVEKNGFFARYDMTTRETTTIGRPGFFLTDTSLRFITGERFFAIIDPSGGLFVFDRTAGVLTPITGGIKDAVFDSEEKKLLLVRERSVSVLWLDDNIRQPFQKKGAMEEVIALDRVIREARWLYKTDSHIVWRDRDGIALAEIDRRGAVNIAELVSGAVDELATFPSLPDAVFYRKGKTIYKIEL